VLNTAQTTLLDVLTARRRQLPLRVTACLTILSVYGPFSGWQWGVACAVGYLLLQAAEVLWLPSLLAGSQAQAQWARRVALLALFLSAASFCAPAIPLTIAFGGWGVACAAYLVGGTIVNSALTTVGCREAFIASAVPAFAYVLGLPVLELGYGKPPLLVITVNFALGGMFLVVNIWQLWSSSTRSKAAEVMAMRCYIAGRDENEARLFRLTQLDTLTGLLNRDVLQARLAGMIADGRPGTLMLIDLDGFKYINDTLGHAAGDAVLCSVAKRLSSAARHEDAAARLGGDEFALLLAGATSAAAAAIVAERLIAEISQPVVVDGHPINIGASVGIALHPLHGRDAGQIFANADLALYQAKGEGRHCARLFTNALRDAAEGKVLRDTELREALENGEFELYYQPQVRLTDGALMGAEALLRWRHPTQGLLSPASFICALEGGLLSARVGLWVLETACAQAKLWRAQFAPDFRIGVNLFGSQFRAGNLAEWVNTALIKTGLPPEALEIEITENIILRHEDTMIEPLRALRQQGVGVAFDDYGTGFASLSMLTRYPVSRLKIDRGFTRTVCEDPAEAAIVRAIIGLGHSLGLNVTAEGVETRNQLAWLRKEGCQEGQGYFFGRPMSAAAFYAQFSSVAPSPAALLI
jgi:diguanylate cyclase (GGDEF)-like protein